MYGYGYSPFIKSASSSGGIPVDPDAQAFITAAAITDPTQQSAINQLVVDLKGYGVWTKMKALYPFVGGTASQHKFNLKDPRDLDAAFRLVFNGGWTHGAGGIIPNGINTKADTFVIPLNVLQLNSTHMSYYSRSNTNGVTNVEMGNGDAPFNRRIYIAPKYGGNNSNYRAINSDQVGPGTSPIDTRGLFIVSRISSSQIKQYQNTNTLHTDNVNSVGLQTVTSILIGATRDNSDRYYTDRTCAFASIGDGLLDSEANNLYLCVQQFNTTLGRQV